MDRTEIAALAWRWFDSRRTTAGMTLSMERLTTPVEVPDALLDSVTREPAARRQVLEDAGWWLACPRPLGLGMQMQLAEELEVAPFEGWSRTISPFAVTFSWVDRMDPRSQQVETRRDSIHRLVWEDWRWRVGALWGDAERARHFEQLEMIRRALGGVSSR